MAKSSRIGSDGEGRISTWDLLLYAIAALLLTHVWRIQSLFPVLGPFKLVIIASMIALIAFTLSPDPRRSFWSIHRHPIAKCIGALLVLTALSVPGSLRQGGSFFFLVQDFGVTVLLAGLLAASVRTLEDVERLAAVQVAGVGLFMIVVLARFKVGIGGRLGSLVYYDANDLGMLIAATLPLIVYFLRSEAAWSLRLAAGGLLPLSILILVKTGSRGAFLGLLAVAVFMVFRFQAISRKARFGAVAAAMLCLLIFAGDSYWDMMRTLLNPQEDYNWAGNSESGRFEVWKRGIGYMLGHPVLGIGAGSFPAAEGTISPLAVRQQYGIGLKWSAAHNAFIQIGAELGIPGLILFILLLTVAYRTCARIGRLPAGRDGPIPAEVALAQALMASLVGYVVTAFFLSQAYSGYLYATLGIILGLVKVAQSREVRVGGGTQASRGSRRPYGRVSAVPVRSLRSSMGRGG